MSLLTQYFLQVSLVFCVIKDLVEDKRTKVCVKLKTDCKIIVEGVLSPAVWEATLTLILSSSCSGIFFCVIPHMV